MSPTVFKEGPYRFYFFSREEPRMHVHVHGLRGEAKFGLQPKISVAQNYGLTAQQLNAVLQIVQEREDEIRKAWEANFPG